MRTVLSVRLPEKMAKELNTLAREMGRNKSDILKESISLYLWEERFRKSRRSLGLRAKQAGLVTEEDVLKGVS